MTSQTQPSGAQDLHTGLPEQSSPATTTPPPIQPPRLAKFHTPGAVVAALAALALAMHELSTLCAGFVTGVGDNTSPGMLGSPWARKASTHWNDALSGDLIDGLEPQVVWSRMVLFYQLLDLCFIVIYTIALLAVVRAVQKKLQDGPQGEEYRGKWPVTVRGQTISGASWLVVALAAADLLENVLHTLMAIQRCPDPRGCVPDSLIDGSVVVTLVKWGLLAVVIVAGALAARRAWEPFWARTRELVVATWEQRFSLLAFLPIAALSVLPLGSVVSDLFDQLPDVQRRWLDGWSDLFDLGWAALIFVFAVWLPILFLCRIRADWAVRRQHRGDWWPNYDSPQANPDNPDETSARRLHAAFWFSGPALLLVAAGIGSLSGGHVYWPRLVAFCSVPVVVGIASLALLRMERKARQAGKAPRLLPPQQRRDREPDERQHAREDTFGSDVMAVGDVIVAAAASLIGLAAVRAFAGPVVMSWWGLLDLGNLRAVGQWVLLLLGFAGAIAAWPFTRALLSSLGDGPPSAALSRIADGSVAGTGARDPSQRKSLPGRLADRAASAVRSSLDEQTDPVGLRALVVPGFDPPREKGDSPRITERVEFLLGSLTLSSGVFILLCVFPRGTAERIGALAAATLTVGTLIIMLGLLVAYAQEHQPPELFQVRWPWRNRAKDRDRRVRTTPVTAMFIVAVGLAAFAGGSTDVHAVENDSATLPERPTMADAFTAWVNAPGACTVPYEKDNRFRVRPMLMYAAEGGGIRAAYWTASALDRIAYPGEGDREDSPTCGRHAAFFSTGASGGAVGLAVSRFSDAPRHATERMAGPDALGAAAISLVAGDLLTSSAGIRFGSRAEHRNPDRQGLDRAGLMETTWEDIPGLSELQTAFVTDDVKDATDSDGSVTGQLVLVSSIPLDGCRALLSQMKLAGPAKSLDGWPECGGDEAGKNGFDLFSTYGVPQGEQPEDAGNKHCLGNVRTLTAGLLASRFPYVTPSGVVGPCGDRKPLQAIDGGYTDNSGLGTIVDLADQWTDLVRDHNDAVLSQRTGDLVVPMVVFLENGAGEDYTVPDAEAEGVTPAEVKAQKTAEKTKGGNSWNWPRTLDIPEVLIPPIGYYNAPNHKAKALAALELAEAEVADSLCSGSGAACEALKHNKHTRIHSYVVHQTRQPSMAAPLGWVLSKASVAEMDDDLCVQEKNPSGLLDGDGQKDTKDHEKYGTLHDVLTALGLPSGSRRC